MLRRGGSAAVAFEVCAKCGSTSLFDAVYAAVFGKSFKRNIKPPWVQNWQAWPKVGLPQGSMVVGIQQADKALHERPGANKVYFQVTRDPVDRYISAFHSKLKCCKDGIDHGNPSANQSNPRRACANDCKDGVCTRLGSLVRKAGPASAAMAALPCLYFDEFATLLQRVHHLKNQYTMTDTHFRAQRVEIPAGWMGWVGTIQEVGNALNGLKHLGLHPIVMKKTHESERVVWVDKPGDKKADKKAHRKAHTEAQPWNPTNFGLGILCKLAETEYAELGYNVSAGPCQKADHIVR